MNGEGLIDALCSKIQDFPSANCQVLEDIDALIERDMKIGGSVFFEEEVESIVCEIEREIMEEVLHDDGAV